MKSATPVRRPFLAATPDFAAGRDTPRAYLERCLERIDELEPSIAAFVALNLERARADADRSVERWRAGKPLSQIDGMPLGIKDIIETADMPTDQGSHLFVGYRTGRDAATVAAAREAGGVVVGKTVTTEFASTEPLGHTRNPWDLERTPGGSSSGSAASVAVGMVPAALGTQVVGSILRPASYCGTFGFKPSVGGINRGGSYDGMSQSCDGPLSATLEDAWVVAREISARVGGDPGFPGLGGPMAPPPGVKPTRVALLETAGWAVATQESKDRLADAVERIRGAGVEIVSRQDDRAIGELEDAISRAEPLSRRINNWEGRWPLNAYREQNRAGLSEAALDRLTVAESMTLEEYQELIAERAAVRALYAERAAACDGCVTLSAPGPAPKGLGHTGNPIFVCPGSYLGIPTISLPVFTVEEGLPLGLQVMGFEQRDAAAFSLAAWLYQLLAA
jgi:Asp-tRNA(Asn)/Glu-tRNA(Gln) amidotransferase A subunit family amidase